MDAREMAKRSWATRRRKYSAEELRSQQAIAGAKGGAAGKGKKKPRKPKH